MTIRVAGLGLVANRTFSGRADGLQVLKIISLVAPYLKSSDGLPL